MKSEWDEKEIKLIFNDEDAQVTFVSSSQLLYKVNRTDREYLPLVVYSTFGTWKMFSKKNNLKRTDVNKQQHKIVGEM